MPRPRSETLNTISSPRRIAASVTVWPGAEKPIALDSRLNRIWRTRRPSARSEPTPSVAMMRNSIAEFGEPVLDAFGRRLHRLGDVDFLQPQFERAGVDRRQIENVVDDGEQSRRRFGDIAGIFELLLVEFADDAFGEQLREADDVGERRAQFVGDVMDEIVAQLLGADQRLVALHQHALDMHARRHVEEGQQGRAVGQRHRRAIEHEAVLALDPRLIALALFRQADDDGAHAE